MDGMSRARLAVADRVGSFHVFDGVYEAQRAAELAGVPKTTVYDWARKGVVVPSVSSSRVMLWSFADLFSLRITYWLRHPKGEVPATSMKAVRSALSQLEDLGRKIWDPVSGESPVLVDYRGTVFLRDGGSGIADLHGQMVMSEEILDPTRPFGLAGLRGPDLLTPRPHLRIIPGKVSGEPHLVESRLTSPAVAALSRRGFSIDRIVDLYPHEDPVGIGEAIDLEQEISPAAA